jgi:hypothetical protein
MLRLNKELLFVRVNRYEYLLKKGTLSNYSFTILDEDELGFLSILFEDLIYPLAEEGIVKRLEQELKMTKEKIKEILLQLKEAEVLIEHTEAKKLSICALAPSEIKDQVHARLAEVIESNIKTLDLKDVNYRYFNIIVHVIKFSSASIFLNRYFSICCESCCVADYL